MNKITIAIFAHPDDESFGPGGTLAQRAEEGCEVHVITVTKGEEGGEKGVEKLREKEVKAAAKALGVTNHHFFDFKDGTLNNFQYHEVANQIRDKVKEIISGRECEVDFITFDRLGISGHLDHIAVSMITTYYYRQFASLLEGVKKARLLYFVITKESRDKPNDNYFVYGPSGVDDEDIDLKLDISSVFDKKIAAIKAHASQSPENILARGDKLRFEHFMIYNDD